MVISYKYYFMAQYASIKSTMFCISKLSEFGKLNYNDKSIMDNKLQTKTIDDKGSLMLVQCSSYYFDRRRKFYEKSPPLEKS